MSPYWPFQRRVVLKAQGNPFLLKCQPAEIQIEVYLWQGILHLAKEYLWQPEGTLPPEGEDPKRWTGDYHEPCGQEVVARDASHLADALEGAIDRVPPNDDENYDNPWGRVAGHGATIRKLIKFLQYSGGFTIDGPVCLKMTDRGLVEL